MKHRDHTTLFKVLTSKFTMLVITFVMMALVIRFERRAFVAHVLGVTYQLLTVLVQLNRIYAQLDDTNMRFFYFVFGAGIVHTFVPIVGMFYSTFMFIHIGFCFCLHILHMADCYTIFTKLSVTDSEYIVILITVNIMEFTANVAYMFPNVVSDRGMALIFLSVQLMALLISLVKVERKQVGGVNVIMVAPKGKSRGTNGVVSIWDKDISQYGHDFSNDDYDDQPEEEVPSLRPLEVFKPKSTPYQQKVVAFFTNRFVIVTISEAIVLGIFAYPHEEYCLYQTGMGIFFAIIVAKCDLHRKASFYPILVAVKALVVLLLFVVPTILCETKKVSLFSCVVFTIISTTLIASHIYYSMKTMGTAWTTVAQIMGCFLISLPAQITVLINPENTEIYATELSICFFSAYCLIISTQEDCKDNPVSKTDARATDIA